MGGGGLGGVTGSLVAGFRTDSVKVTWQDLPRDRSRDGREAGMSRDRTAPAREGTRHKEGRE